MKGDFSLKRGMWDSRTTMARTSPRSDAIPHPSNLDPQGKHGQEGVLGRKRSVEGSFGDDVEDDETKKQCEEEKYCSKVDCPKVTSEVDQGSAKMRTEYADEKVNEDGGEEAMEGEMEGQQGPKLKVVLERQKESGKQPLRDPTVEEQEVKWSEQQVRWQVGKKG
eukprot:s5882_g4.t1